MNMTNGMQLFRAIQQTEEDPTPQYTFVPNTNKINPENPWEQKMIDLVNQRRIERLYNPYRGNVSAPIPGGGIASQMGSAALGNAQSANSFWAALRNEQFDQETQRQQRELEKKQRPTILDAPETRGFQNPKVSFPNKNL